MSTRYFHLRRIADGKIASQGGVTIAIMKHVGKDEGYKDKVSIGISVCSLRDNFSRKHGRDVARVRAHAKCGTVESKHPLFAFIEQEDLDLVDALKKAVVVHAGIDYDVIYPTLTQTVRCDK